MIPIIIGPQGPGYINAYIDENNDLIEITTLPNSTGIKIGKINCYTGTTGTLGPTGWSNNWTGPSAIVGLTGPTGTNLEYLLYNPTECKLRFIYNKDINDFGPFECKKDINSITGSTGPIGPSLDYLTLMVNCENFCYKPVIQNIYNDGQIIDANICILCTSMTGFTGTSGITTEYGATGATGLEGVITEYGNTGPTGIEGEPINVDDIIDKFSTINGINGSPGSYIFNNFASIKLINFLQFNVVSGDSIKRPYVYTKQRSEVLFPNTPLNVNLQYTINDPFLFTELSDGILCNVKALIRIRMSWQSNDIFTRPFAVINQHDYNTFPTLITMGYSNITQSDDMYCIVNSGDIINILPGAYLKYPVPLYQTVIFSFSNINLDIVTVYIY